jgi:hypothetical protein
MQLAPPGRLRLHRDFDAVLAGAFLHTQFQSTASRDVPGHDHPSFQRWGLAAPPHSRLQNSNAANASTNRAVQGCCNGALQVTRQAWSREALKGEIRYWHRAFRLNNTKQTSVSPAEVVIFRIPEFDLKFLAPPSNPDLDTGRQKGSNSPASGNEMVFKSSSDEIALALPRHKLIFLACLFWKRSKIIHQKRRCPMPQPETR